MKKTFLKFSLALAIPFAIASCGDKGHDHEGHDHDHGDHDHTEMNDESAEESTEESTEEVTTEESTEEVTDTTAATDALSFAEGTWGYSLQHFLDSEEAGTKTFALDQLNLSDGDEEEELSAEADLQLDELASILKAHPGVVALLGGHSKEASNVVGKKTKKVWSQAKSFFVKKKLMAKGVDESQVNNKGYGDEKLLEGVDGKDGSQNRITIEFSK